MECRESCLDFLPAFCRCYRWNVGEEKTFTESEIKKTKEKSRETENDREK